jgi:hypothetical protein
LRDYTCDVKPTMSGTPVSHAAEGRPPLITGADASRESTARGNRIRQILSVVLALNLAVAGAKLGYGFVSGSVAMSADGFHSLLDGFANVVGIVGIAVAARPPDREHHFGHGRYETLASMAIGALMAVGVLEIVQSAIDRWQTGETPQVTQLSFGVMLGTIAINTGVTIWERRAARRLRSDLLEADARHTGSDVLVSAAVILGLIGERSGRHGGMDGLGDLARGIACAYGCRDGRRAQGAAGGDRERPGCDHRAQPAGAVLGWTKLGRSPRDGRPGSHRQTGA